MSKCQGKDVNLKTSFGLLSFLELKRLNYRKDKSDWKDKIAENILKFQAFSLWLWKLKDANPYFTFYQFYCRWNQYHVTNKI